MKYLSKRQILESLDHLATLNQFFGLTFLSAKKANLPVGESISVSLDALNRDFINKFYKLNPDSAWFFRVFRFNDKNRFWLRPDYPSGKGLQKLNTTTYKDAFIHKKNSKDWGWQNGYVDFLASFLTNTQVPAFHMATWLLRKKSWEESANQKSVIEFFFNEFNITQEEREKLFTLEVNSNLIESDAFQEIPVTWQEIEAEFVPPPDVEPDKGGILTYLEVEGVGPVSPLAYEPGKRLNLLTGDNGLGKTFLLDVAWWALTGKWANRAAYPNRQSGSPPKGRIKFSISGSSTGKPQIINYSSKENSWPEPQKRETISGLIVYARVDGSFAIWDPAEDITNAGGDRTLLFNREEIWDGKSGRIEGLVRDWTKWQDNPDRSPFDIFKQVLACMSPPEMGNLVPGEPVRLPFDRREIPTIKHHYGEVPILYESAGIRRVVTLAYLMVWAWNEHKITAKQLGSKVENRMVVMVDEVEAHLHPRWQRVILPALLKVAGILSTELEMQLMVATHSPLVLASAEPVFNTTTDKLFHLEATQSGKIVFEETPFVRYGLVDSWLTSDLFDLQQARSRDSEQILSKAISLQQEEEPNIEDIRRITRELADSLPPEDSFWPRWVFFAQAHGVDL